MFAVCLALAGATLSVTPKVKRDGPWSVIPTPILIALVPYADDPMDHFNARGSGHGTPPHGVHMEIHHRIRRYELCDWHWTFLAWQTVRDPRFDFDLTMHMPHRSTEREPISFSIEPRTHQRLPVWLARAVYLRIRAEPKLDPVAAAKSAVVTWRISLSSAEPTSSRRSDSTDGLFGTLTPGTHQIPIEISWTLVPTMFGRPGQAEITVWRNTIMHELIVDERAYGDAVDAFESHSTSATHHKPPAAPDHF